MGHPFVSFEEQKGKIYQACILSRTRPRHRPIIYLGEARGPSTSDQSFRCTRREGQHILRQSPGETRDCSGRAYSPTSRRRLPAGTFLGQPYWTTQHLEFRCRGRRGGICDAVRNVGVARALLEALQEKRQGHQLLAAMAPLARIRAPQLQQCVANGTEPQEAVIQAALDLIAVGQGPSDPVAQGDKVATVSQMPDVQRNATLPAQDSSSSINTTACAEVTANSLYRTVTLDNHTSSIGLVSGPTHKSHALKLLLKKIDGKHASMTFRLPLHPW